MFLMEHREEGKVLRYLKEQDYPECPQKLPMLFIRGLFDHTHSECFFSLQMAQSGKEWFQVIGFVTSVSEDFVSCTVQY